MSAEFSWTVVVEVGQEHRCRLLGSASSEESVEPVKERSLLIFLMVASLRCY